MMVLFPMFFRGSKSREQKRKQVQHQETPSLPRSLSPRVSASQMNKLGGSSITPADPDLKPSTKCHLLALPAELRVQIYQLTALQHLSEDLWNNQPGFLHIKNRQIREEFEDVWYKEMVAAEYYDRKLSEWRAVPEGIVKIILDSQQDGGDGVWIDGSRGSQSSKGIFSTRLKTREVCREQADAGALFDSDWHNTYPLSYIGLVVIEVVGRRDEDGGKNCALAQINADMISEANQRKFKDWFVLNKLCTYD